MADRYRGYGHPAGCGLDRRRAAPALKRTPQDTDVDLERYRAAVGRACALGDTEACALAELAPRTTVVSTAGLEDARLRSAVEGSALWRWARESRPEHAALLDAARRECMRMPGSWECDQVGIQLYRHGSDAQKELPASVRSRALAICRDTLECGDVWMMLDDERYPVEALVPLRTEMGEVLAEACLEGACVCGQAAKLLPAGDPRRVPLAEAGCRDGEAEGCYELARAIEDGQAGPPDLARAMDLYRVACPSQRPVEDEPGPRQGEYSPRACDRLAQHHQRGEMPPKDGGHAFWYAQAACQRAGKERDHAPCLRLARYHAHGPRTGRNREDANLAALGPEGNPVRRRACKRSSMAEACAAVQDEIAHVRR
jgi:TPR repeat protein